MYPHGSVVRLWVATIAIVAMVVGLLFLVSDISWARNINQYSDRLSTSAPGVLANHTLSFRLDVAVSPGAYFEVTPPEGFTIVATTSFSERNVELWVNGSPRRATTTASPGFDQVNITPGSPGKIRYTLEPTAGIAAGSQLQLRIGDNTSVSSVFSLTISTTTGTSTTPEDTPGIQNSPVTGTHVVDVRVYDGSEVANAGFVVAIVEQVAVGPVDTTEEIPPLRFNGAPTSTVGGTTLNIEISLETDEFAVCKFSATPDVAYSSMTNTFTNTGLIFHSTIVPAVPNTLQTLYIRCVDDEGNINIDDFIIEFTVLPVPTGSANTEGGVSGDGTGQGNQGTGGGGSGGFLGDSDGQGLDSGGTSGSGSSGGGGGGGRGPREGTSGGGGFESTDEAYRSGDGQVEISGYAFPRSRVTVLVDGKQAGQVTAGSSGSYSMTLSRIARGVYTFGVYATDANQVRSTTFSTSFTVSGARTTALSNINLTPSIRVQPDPVQPGQPATISGYTQPNAVVTLETERDKNVASRRILTATADGGGAWSISLDTSSLQNGTHKARARSAVANPLISTGFSNYTFYGVGQSAERPISAELSRDGRVNLTDFSILLFWWNTSGGDSNPSADINGDGRVNLTDFSILLFNWTG